MQDQSDYDLLNFFYPDARLYFVRNLTFLADDAVSLEKEYKDRYLGDLEGLKQANYEGRLVLLACRECSHKEKN